MTGCETSTCQQLEHLCCCDIPELIRNLQDAIIDINMSGQQLAFSREAQGGRLNLKGNICL